MGKIAISVAVCLLMLHTLMPHSHSDQISDEQHIIEHSEADSLLDYIRLAFHLNPGENHLEEFEQASNVAVYLPVAEIPQINVPTQLLITSTVNFTNAQNIVGEHQFISLSLSFRGPPQLI